MRDWSMGGASDADVLAAAVARGYVVVTENVADFTRLASNYASRGQAHPGAIIAFSTRSSRRRSGIPAIVAALTALATDSGTASDDDTTDRVIYLH